MVKWERNRLCKYLQSRTKATAAGDCWNAADIVGYLAGLDPRERLTFAIAYASSCVRNIYAEPPTMKETFEFLEVRKPRGLELNELAVSGPSSSPAFRVPFANNPCTLPVGRI